MIVSRILPGDDLKKGLIDIMDNKCIKSGIILCMVGSLTEAVLRLANGDKKLFIGPFEIVSAEGTISIDGVHAHIAISDREGSVFGGHLLYGCKIHTTAEISIMESENYFRRVYDPKTGYKELFIENLE
jgi:uncharacterized protein